MAWEKQITDCIINHDQSNYAKTIEIKVKLMTVFLVYPLDTLVWAGPGDIWNYGIKSMGYINSFMFRC